MNLLLANIWLPALSDLRLFTPELVLVGTIAAVLVVPLFVGRSAYLAALIAMTGALMGLLATGQMALHVAGAGQAGMAPPDAAPMLIADGFSVFFKLFLLLLLVLVIWLWTVGASSEATDPRGSARLNGSPIRADAPGAIGSPEFFVLLLTSALGMMLMVGTLNLLVMVVAMETASLPSYAMAASNKRSRLGAEAGLKYVMFGAAAAAIMVYGVSLLYGRFGTLDLGTIAEKVAGGTISSVAHAGATLHGADAVFWLGLAAIGAGITFKIAAFPMHLWCPDVFEGAPVEVTTWLSIASKAAGLGLLLRIVTTFASGFTEPQNVLQPLALAIGVLAAITCTVGNLAALRQESVKRILAYSSIAHAGYMMMAAAILIGGANLPANGVNIAVAAVISYLFVYIVMNVGAFGATALVAWHTGTDHLSAFTGLGRRAPWLALPMAVCLFSLVGLPPLGGFAAKWFLLVALGRSAAAQPWLWGLVIVAVINTAVSLYYYVRIIRQMYLTDDAAQARMRLPVGGLAVVNACAIALLLLGTWWFSGLGDRAEKLGSNLYDPIAARVEQAPVARVTLGS
jgi:NADH-quinone oxidoreductase subunit N